MESTKKSITYGCMGGIIIALLMAGLFGIVFLTEALVKN